jgi:Nucleotide modification associated domain 2
MKLYSYCLRSDSVAAPNPFWGVCTLVICKPAIRRTAHVGDWVVGFGSANSPIGDISRGVVYAMKVTRIMTMQEYDAYCKTSLKEKLPRWDSEDYREKVGDCIYDFSEEGMPAVRKSVHSEACRKKDLGGMNALLSDRFYYFGDKPVLLPNKFIALIHAKQGHKVAANDALAEAFVGWLAGLGYKRNGLYGEPQLKQRLKNDQNEVIYDFELDADDED